MGSKFALIIGNTEYTDPGLAQLTAPGKDAEDFAHVLEDREIGAFEGGYGRIILTASDSTQFAWEGDKVIGETDNSLFTHYLVEGLRGDADNDGDGRITVDELYDYVYEKVRRATPKQTPSKFSSKQQGEIVLRQSTRVEDIKPVPLPTPLLDSIENPFADVRLGAVQQLSKLLSGKNLALARSAREALEEITKKDDSRQVSNAAAQALGLGVLSEQFGLQREAKEAHHATATKEASSKVDDDAVTLPLGGQALITLGWAIGGLIGGLIYNTFGATLAGAFGGAVGGFITALALRNAKLRSNSGSLIWFSLAWAIGGAVGWMIGEVLTEAIGIAIGFVLGASISVAILLSKRYLTFNWTSIVWIVLAWAIGGAIGWSIARGLIYEASVEYGIGWAIGMAIGWTIGGYVLGWQLLNNQGERES